ncbi:hypothetical protein HAX54_004308, partial [Datura stramonium]|nr:hypothetical protein [Datura stramonium]
LGHLSKAIDARVNKSLIERVAILEEDIGRDLSSVYISGSMTIESSDEETAKTPKDVKTD